MQPSINDMVSRYVMALGTPYPVGEFVLCNDRKEMIVGYEFDLTQGGLIAVTDFGSKVSDYNDLADGVRRANIKRFFQCAS